MRKWIIVLAAALAASAPASAANIWAIGKNNEAAVIDSAGNLTMKGVVSSTGGYKVAGQVAFSSVPVMHVGGFNSTLASGVTFFAFTPDSAITLRRASAVIVVAGTGGSGDEWKCGNGTVSLSVTSGAGAGAGTKHTAAGSANVSAGSQVSCWLESAASPTPTANVVLEYVIQ